MNDASLPDRYNVPLMTTLSADDVLKASQVPPQGRPLIRQRAVFTDKVAVPK